MAELIRPTPILNEPKRVNRFVLEFPTELGFESWQVQTSGRPAFKQNAVAVEMMNTTFHVAGKYTWDPITITFMDTIGKSAGQTTIEWVRLSSESITGRQGYAAGYMKNIVLKDVDPTGVEIGKWVLYNCMITEASWGENNLGEDGLQMVSITVQPQYCIMESYKNKPL